MDNKILEYLKRLATKDDLEKALEQTANKDDLNAFATKEDLHELFVVMKNGFDHVYEELAEAKRHRTEIELKLEEWRSDSRALWESYSATQAASQDNHNILEEKVNELDESTKDLKNRVKNLENKAS